MIRELLQSNILLFDGGTGTLLQRAGLPLGELPERWNLTHADLLVEIHEGYFNAGSHIVCTNTFGANSLKLPEEELERVISSAVGNAKRARERSVGEQPKLIALDIGPLGKLLKPYGDFSFESAVETFAKTVRLGVKQGVDLIFIETMGDSYEAKAAVVAAKENCDLPVILSCAYGGDGKLMTGASPSAMVALAEGLGVDAIGVNCSQGPLEMRGVVAELLQTASVPVLVKPNAGLPTTEGGYDVDEESFAACMAEYAKMGARILGGCCGTTPAHIRALQRAVEGIEAKPIEDKNRTCVSSYTHAVAFDKPLLIGERINPTGKKRFRQALKEGEVGYILAEGIAQQEKGAHILDVNVGAPEIDEVKELPRYIEELQAVIDLPLQIDTSNYTAMERAMRLYNGKPLVNSVNGKEESMNAVFPLVKKYGGAVIALTLDEEGIPSTVEGRLAIAEKIIQKAKEYGIPQKEIIVDPLAMAISADESSAAVTLQTVKALSARGIKTSLGVSNISFGLPARDCLNATFFALALQNGLSAGIINPNSLELQKAYYAYTALAAKDKNCEKYIAFAAESLGQTPTQTVAEASRKASASPLQEAIQRGLKEEAAAQTRLLIKERAPLEIIDGEIVPALDHIGRAYEEKRAFLPQLLVCAESAKQAFEVIKTELAKRGAASSSKGKILLATVKGDIHDIGKNIVASLLENYGFTVVDLGRDVPPLKIVERAIAERIPIVGLSALMTTTLPSMAETVSLLKEKAPWVKTVVGGAVVTKEYAEQIGATAYSKDAMQTVRFAESVMQKK